MTCPRCWACSKEERDGNPCAKNPIGGMLLDSQNHPEAFLNKEVGAKRGPGHIPRLGDYSNSGLSPKPVHALLVLVTKGPNERAKETGHHCMDSRAKSFLTVWPISV